MTSLSIRLVPIARGALMAGLRATAAFRPAERLAARGAHSGLATTVAGSGSVRVRRLGTSFTLDLADNVQRTLYLTGTYEPAFLRFLKSELRPGDVYVDVGAHIGIDAIVAAREVGLAGHVYAFEAAPDTAARLAEVTQQFRNVSVANVALGARTGTVTLRSDPMFHPNDASTRSLFTTGAVICEVQMTTLDMWGIGVDRLDVVKIDIEGGEYDAIAGMTSTLSRLRPRTIIVEIQFARQRMPDPSDQDVYSLLHDRGYVESGESFLDNVVFRSRARSS